MALHTRQVVGITLSLLVVGGATAYAIHHFRGTAPTTPKLPKSKKRAKRHVHAPGTVPHERLMSSPPPPPMHPSPYGRPGMYTEQQHAFPPPPHYASPQYYAPSQHQAPPPSPPAPPAPHVDYYPTPMPPLTQPTHTHEWPRQSPAGQDQTAPVHATADPQPDAQSMNPTYWRDIATSLGLITPKSPLLKIQEAQEYLNKLGVVPHGEVLKVDNINGERTHNALSDFQEKHHLPMTGELNPETGAALLYDVYQMYRAQSGGAPAQS